MTKAVIVVVLVLAAGVAGAGEKPADKPAAKPSVEDLQSERNAAVELAEQLKAEVAACRSVLEGVAKSDTARAGDLFKALGR